MTRKNSAPDATPSENQNGTIEIPLDDAFMAAAVAAQTELIDMLARLILQAIDNQAIEHDTQTASPKKRSRTRRTMP